MVPAAVLIAFLLLGVEEIGVQIEEPFGILPLGKRHLSNLYIGYLLEDALSALLLLDVDETGVHRGKPVGKMPSW